MSALCLALTAAQMVPCATAPAWRPVATDADRQRLRDARTAWTEALEEAHGKGGAGVGDALLDPDRALDRPLPPPGLYHCRLVKLGGAAGFAEREWGRCRVDGDSFAKLDGPQRPMGRLYGDSDSRAVFLGSLVLGDEAHPLGYGRDTARDMAGVVERIGEARWRVTLPYPRFESKLDVIELLPGG